MKKILHLMFGRFFVVAMAIILQVLWLCVVLWQLSYKFTYVNLLVRVIAIIVVLVIVNKWTNPANKLSWTFLILLSPIFGLMVYFLSDQTYKRENGCCQPSGGSIVSER